MARETSRQCHRPCVTGAQTQVSRGCPGAAVCASGFSSGSRSVTLARVITGVQRLSQPRVGLVWARRQGEGQGEVGPPRGWGWGQRGHPASQRPSVPRPGDGRGGAGGAAGTRPVILTLAFPHSPGGDAGEPLPGSALSTALLPASQTQQGWRGERRAGEQGAATRGRCGCGEAAPESSCSGEAVGLRAQACGAGQRPGAPSAR